MARTQIRLGNTEESPREDFPSSPSSPSVAEVLPDSEPRLSPLRPRGTDEFIGQRQVLETVMLAVSGARSRGESVDHILLHGPPGLGKTTLALLVAEEMGTKCHITSGPILEKPADLATTLTALEPGDVLFVDEIHRLKANIGEFLYPAMEDFRMDIRIGDGPHGQSISLPLEPFTLIGATTRSGMLNAPMRMRFGLDVRFEPYGVDDLADIILRAAGRLGVSCADTAARIISEVSRGTPRHALNLLKRARDVATSHQSTRIDDQDAIEGLRIMGIDAHGLGRADREILRILVARDGAAIGLGTLAAALDEDPGTIEEKHEPYLLQRGLIERTPRGRIATPAAHEIMGSPSMRPSQLAIGL